MCIILECNKISYFSQFLSVLIHSSLQLFDLSVLPGYDVVYCEGKRSTTLMNTPFDASDTIVYFRRLKLHCQMRDMPGIANLLDIVVRLH